MKSILSLSFLAAGLSLVGALPFHHQVKSRDVITLVPAGGAKGIAGPNAAATTNATVVAGTNITNSSTIVGSWLTVYSFNGPEDLANVNYTKFTHMTYSFVCV
jgi:hypothetical protein